MSDRQRSHRYPFSCLVTFVDRPFASSLAQTLSAQGCSILAAHLDLQAGQAFPLEVQLSRHWEGLYVDSAVVRWIDDWYAGLEFVVMSPRERIKLDRFLEATNALCGPNTESRLPHVR